MAISALTVWVEVLRKTEQNFLVKAECGNRFLLVFSFHLLIRHYPRYYPSCAAARQRSYGYYSTDFFGMTREGRDSNPCSTEIDG